MSLNHGITKVRRGIEMKLKSFNFFPSTPDWRGQDERNE